MKVAKKTSPLPAAHDLVTEAKKHFHAAADALRKGCAEALLTGLNLIALHAEHAGNGHGGNRVTGASVSRGTLEKGFLGALEEIGIPKRTAYRWMNAASTALVRGLNLEGPEDNSGSIRLRLDLEDQTIIVELTAEDFAHAVTGMHIETAKVRTRRYHKRQNAESSGFSPDR